MTTYQPQPGIFVGRPPCHCGAAYRLHGNEGACPSPYRPDTLAVAIHDLRRAVAAADTSRIFAARGDVQRLLGHRPGTCTPLCEGCDVLLAADRGCGCPS